MRRKMAPAMAGEPRIIIDFRVTMGGFECTEDGTGD